jgi:CRISPR-associated protein Cas6
VTKLYTPYGVEGVMLNGSSDPADFMLDLPINGYRVPIDHGYKLYGAITQLNPALHEAGGWFLHPLRGACDAEYIYLDHRSRLCISVSSSLAKEVVRIAGKRAMVDSEPLRFGLPSVRSFEPCSKLYAAFVTFAKVTEEEVFSDLFQTRLSTLLGTGATFTLGRKRIRRVAGAGIVGYDVAVVVSDEASSLLLQQVGIGGRRRMGGGVFVPVKPR